MTIKTKCEQIRQQLWNKRRKDVTKPQEGFPTSASMTCEKELSEDWIYKNCEKEICHRQTQEDLSISASITCERKVSEGQIYDCERERMSPSNPRGLANGTANDLILSNFPEQGNELVGWCFDKYHVVSTNNDIDYFCFKFRKNFCYRDISIIIINTVLHFRRVEISCIKISMILILCSSECEDFERVMGDLSLPLLRHLHPSVSLFRYILLI